MNDTTFEQWVARNFAWWEDDAVRAAEARAAWDAGQAALRAQESQLTTNEQWIRNITPDTSTANSGGAELDAAEIIKCWREQSPDSTVTDEDAEDLLFRMIAYGSSRASSTPSVEQTAREIGVDTDFPLSETLKLLVEWMRHLDITHNCDCDGWEEQSFLIEAAERYRAEIEANARRVSSPVDPEKAQTKAMRVVTTWLSENDDADRCNVHPDLVAQLVSRIASVIGGSGDQSSVEDPTLTS